jgi:hypothetical protein
LTRCTLRFGPQPGTLASHQNGATTPKRTTPKRTPKRHTKTETAHQNGKTKRQNGNGKTQNGQNAKTANAKTTQKRTTQKRGKNGAKTGKNGKLAKTGTGYPFARLFERNQMLAPLIY